MTRKVTSGEWEVQFKKCLFRNYFELHDEILADTLATNLDTWKQEILDGTCSKIAAATAAKIAKDVASRCSDNLLTVMAEKSGSNNDECIRLNSVLDDAQNTMAESYHDSSIEDIVLVLDSSDEESTMDDAPSKEENSRDGCSQSDTPCIPFLTNSLENTIFNIFGDDTEHEGSVEDNYGKLEIDLDPIPEAIESSAMESAMLGGRVNATAGLPAGYNTFWNFVERLTNPRQNEKVEGVDSADSKNIPKILSHQKAESQVTNLSCTKNAKEDFAKGSSATNEIVEQKKKCPSPSGEAGSNEKKPIHGPFDEELVKLDEQLLCATKSHKVLSAEKLLKKNSPPRLNASTSVHTKKSVVTSKETLSRERTRTTSHTKCDITVSKKHRIHETEKIDKPRKKHSSDLTDARKKHSSDLTDARKKHSSDLTDTRKKRDIPEKIDVTKKKNVDGGAIVTSKKQEIPPCEEIDKIRKKNSEGGITVTQQQKHSQQKQNDVVKRKSSDAAAVMSKKKHESHEREKADITRTQNSVSAIPELIADKVGAEICMPRAHTNSNQININLNIFAQYRKSDSTRTDNCTLNAQEKSHSTMNVIRDSNNRQIGRQKISLDITTGVDIADCSETGQSSVLNKTTGQRKRMQQIIDTDNPLKKHKSFSLVADHANYIVLPKRKRMRNKLRKIFGDIRTTSEDDEEEMLIQRKRRKRKHSIKSNDSGISVRGSNITSLVSSEVFGEIESSAICSARKRGKHNLEKLCEILAQKQSIVDKPRKSEEIERIQTNLEVITTLPKIDNKSTSLETNEIADIHDNTPVVLTPVAKATKNNTCKSNGTGKQPKSPTKDGHIDASNECDSLKSSKTIRSTSTNSKSSNVGSSAETDQTTDSNSEGESNAAEKQPKSPTKDGHIDASNECDSLKSSKSIRSTSTNSKSSNVGSSAETDQTTDSNSEGESNAAEKQPKSPTKDGHIDASNECDSLKSSKSIRSTSTNSKSSDVGSSAETDQTIDSNSVGKSNGAEKQPTSPTKDGHIDASNECDSLKSSKSIRSTSRNSKSSDVGSSAETDQTMDSNSEGKSNGAEKQPTSPTKDGHIDASNECDSLKSSKSIRSTSRNSKSSDVGSWAETDQTIDSNSEGKSNGAEKQPKSPTKDGHIDASNECDSLQSSKSSRSTSTNSKISDVDSSAETDQTIDPNSEDDTVCSNMVSNSGGHVVSSSQGSTKSVNTNLPSSIRPSQLQEDVTELLEINVSEKDFGPFRVITKGTTISIVEIKDANENIIKQQDCIITSVRTKAKECVSPMKSTDHQRSGEMAKHSEESIGQQDGCRNLKDMPLLEELTTANIHRKNEINITPITKEDINIVSILESNQSSTQISVQNSQSNDCSKKDTVEAPAHKYGQLRVRTCEELGSRWCPTPAVSPTPNTSTVTSVITSTSNHGSSNTNANAPQPDPLIPALPLLSNSSRTENASQIPKATYPNNLVIVKVHKRNGTASSINGPQAHGQRCRPRIISPKPVSTAVKNPTQQGVSVTPSCIHRTPLTSSRSNNRASSSKDSAPGQTANATGTSGRPVCNASVTGLHPSLVKPGINITPVQSRSGTVTASSKQSPTYSTVTLSNNMSSLNVATESHQPIRTSCTSASQGDLYKYALANQQAQHIVKASMKGDLRISLPGQNNTNPHCVIAQNIQAAQNTLQRRVSMTDRQPCPFQGPSSNGPQMGSPVHAVLLTQNQNSNVSLPSHIIATTYIPVSNANTPTGGQQVPIGAGHQYNQQIPMANQQVPIVKMPSVHKQIPVMKQQAQVAYQHIPIINHQYPQLRRQLLVTSNQVPVMKQPIPVLNQQLPPFNPMSHQSYCYPMNQIVQQTNVAHRLPVNLMQQAMPVIAVAQERVSPTTCHRKQTPSPTAQPLPLNLMQQAISAITVAQEERVSPKTFHRKQTPSPTAQPLPLNFKQQAMPVIAVAQEQRVSPKTFHRKQTPSPTAQPLPLNFKQQAMPVIAVAQEERVSPKTFHRKQTPSPTAQKTINVGGYGQQGLPLQNNEPFSKELRAIPETSPRSAKGCQQGQSPTTVEVGPLPQKGEISNLLNVASQPLATEKIKFEVLKRLRLEQQVQLVRQIDCYLINCFSLSQYMTEKQWDEVQSTKSILMELKTDLDNHIKVVLQDYCCDSDTDTSESEKKLVESNAEDCIPPVETNDIRSKQNSEDEELKGKTGDFIAADELNNTESESNSVVEKLEEEKEEKRSAASTEEREIPKERKDSSNSSGVTRTTEEELELLRSMYREWWEPEDSTTNECEDSQVNTSDSQASADSCRVNTEAVDSAIGKATVNSSEIEIINNSTADAVSTTYDKNMQGNYKTNQSFTDNDENRTSSIETISFATFANVEQVETNTKQTTPKIRTHSIESSLVVNTPEDLSHIDEKTTFSNTDTKTCTKDTREADFEYIDYIKPEASDIYEDSESTSEHLECISNHDETTCTSILSLSDDDSSFETNTETKDEDENLSEDSVDAVVPRSPEIAIAGVTSISVDTFETLNKSVEYETIVIDGDDIEEMCESKSCLQCGEPSVVVCGGCLEAQYCLTHCSDSTWTDHCKECRSSLNTDVTCD